MKKKIIFIAIAVLCVLSYIGDSTETEQISRDEHPSEFPSQTVSSESVWTVSDKDVFSILFHQPFTDAADINLNCQSERKKLPSRILSALKETPYAVKPKDGGLFGKDYYAVTTGMGYRYYGEIKDNRPNGFGVLAENEVKLSNWSSISNLIYAGNFKDGVYHGYGALFNSDATDPNANLNKESYLIDNNFNNNLISLGVLYLESYVVYDGTWEKGNADGKGNFFSMSSRYDIQEDTTFIPNGYWGGFLYPSIDVTEIKNNEENGNILAAL